MDYEFSISYHPEKANVVANSLSRNQQARISNMMVTSLNSVKKGEDEVFRYEGQLCVPKNEELRSKILYKARHSKYTIHIDALRCIKIWKWCIDGKVWKKM